MRKIPLTNISLLLIAFMVAIALSGSLHWGFQRDAALYLYTAFLMDRFDAVPYRDFFDANGPLTYWLYYILWKCVGTSNTLFRVADVLSLSLLGYAGWRILRCWSWGAATTGVLLWVLAYLELGPNQSMQREFFAMLFIAGSMNVYLSALPLLLRYGVASALVALAMMIKPVFALAYVAFLLVELIVEPGAGCGSTDASRIRSILLRTIFVRILATATGFIVVILPMAWLLKSKDAWDAFLDIAQHYWRLYMLVTPYAGAVAANDFLSLDTWQGVIRIITLHNAKLWFIPLVLAAKIAWQASPETSQRKRLVLLVVFCLLFAVYPFVTGKYSWPYHWIPFLYFACLLLGSGLFLTLESCRDNTRNRFTGGALTVLLAFEVLLLVDEDPLDWPLLLLYGTAILGLCWWGKRYVMWQSWLPHACVVCMVWVFVGHIRESDYLRPVLSGHYVQRPADDGRVDVIARFLRQHMQPGDEVQNIDWVKGALHAMLLVQARMPTRFMVDLQFRHHADQEYTRQLRQEFIAGLQASMPRFVVSVPTVLQGTEAFNTFPELDAYLTQNYFVVFTDSRFSLQIFERQEGRPHSPQHKNRRNPPLGTRLPDSGS